MQAAQTRLAIGDASGIGAVRRAAVQLAETAGANETQAGHVAIAATELATNVLLHGGGGDVLLQVWQAPGAGPALEILAVDRGRGMADVDRCVRDGYSTAGTAGNGLGAVRRLAREFDVFSAPDAGTVVLARIALGADARGVAVGPACGAVRQPIAGEPVCGDGWALRVDDGALWLLVADGLGHGLLAAEAAQAAVARFGEADAPSVERCVESLHDALSGTRGGALAVAHVRPASGSLRYAGIGNVAGTLVDGGRSRGLVSHNGTAGVQAHRVQAFEYPLPEQAGLLIMHSDGLATRWRLDAYPGLALRHPAVVAAVLYRDFQRGRDDVCVVVLALPSCPDALG